MNKVWNIISAVFVCLCWALFLYRFPHVGLLPKIIMLIILVPYTGKIIYSFLLERSQNKGTSKTDELAEGFTPFAPSDPPSSQDGSCFCPECGAKNQKGVKFCVNCGKPLN